MNTSLPSIGSKIKNWGALSGSIQKQVPDRKYPDKQYQENDPRRISLAAIERDVGLSLGRKDFTV
jgi:hypothetical protein